MVEQPWTPDRDDLVWLTFDPQAGRKQAGRRPALVLSPGAYNTRTGLAFMCPITSQQKGYPFEVELPANLSIRGSILADHLKRRRLEGARRCLHRPRSTGRSGGGA